MLPQLAQALAKAGLSSLRFDFPGNGESEGTFRYANMMDEVCNCLYTMLSSGAHYMMQYSMCGQRKGLSKIFKTVWAECCIQARVH